MKTKSVSQIIALIIIFSLPSIVFSVPADPEARITVTQPDGSQITLKPAGDEFSGHLTTLDDYTVVKNSDGFYYFAQKDAEGKLVPSDMRVDNIRNKPALNFEKNLSPTYDRLLPKNDYNQTTRTYTSKTATAANDTNNVLIIMIRFYDEAAQYFPADFQNLMHQPGFDGYGSMQEFYEEISYDQFTINGDVAGWYTSNNNHFYYGYNDGDNWGASAELVQEAVQAATAFVDFSKYDNDGDGEVDGLQIVHSGPGAETGATEYPWSHRWYISAAGLSPVYDDGVKIDGYTMQPELHSGTEMVRIGVFCHEYGHALGLPDLYDTDGGSIGIGSWGLMSGGSWNGGGRSPAQMCAWSKYQLDWLTPVNITEDIDSLSLTDAALSPNAYRVWTEGILGSQFFLVEYRGQGGFDQFLPGCGIAIWHIDHTVGGNWDETHRLVDLEEADNSENNSSGDMWLNKTFGLSTTPNSDDYNNNPTEVEIEVLNSSCDSEIFLNFKVGLPPSCCIGNKGNIDNDVTDQVDISDILYFVDYAFSTPPGPAPECTEEADIDGSGEADISDLLYIVDFAFGSGPAPGSCE